MGEAQRRKMAQQAGYPSATERSPVGDRVQCPPLGNTGGKGNSHGREDDSQTVTERCRINLSPPEGIHAALLGASKWLGISVTQAAMMAVTAGMPNLASQVAAVIDLASREPPRK